MTEYLLKIGADPQAKDEEDTPPQLYIPGNLKSYFKIPAYVRCANCNESLKLDGEEQKTGVYFCCYCEQEVNHLKEQNEESGWFSDAVGNEKNNLYKDETVEPVPEKKNVNEESPSPEEEPVDEPVEQVVESKQQENVINCENCSTPLQLEQEEIEAGEYYCPFCSQVSKLK